MTFESNEKLPKNPIIPHVNWERVRRSWTLLSELCYENSRGMKSQRFAAVWWRFTKVFDSFGVLF